MSDAPTRTERLAGVAKLYGAIRLFHPSVATGQVDFDAAMLESLPALLAATDAPSYRAGIDALLAHLGDPVTHVIDTTPPSAPGQPQAAPLTEDPEITTIEGPKGPVGVVSASALSAYGPQQLTEAIPRLFKELTKMKAIVFDTRSAGMMLPYYFENFLLGLFEGEVPLPVDRTRMHVGHAPDAGGAHMYYSAFVVPDAKVLSGVGAKSNLPKKPLVFVLDQQAAYQTEAIGLQIAGRARIVWSGPFRGLGAVGAGVSLPDGIVVGLRTAEVVNPDGSVGVDPDAVIDEDADGIAAALELIAKGGRRSAKKSVAMPLARKARRAVDADDLYPPVEQRLLGLFHYWNTIDRHFPYRELMDRDWDDVLLEFIPRVEEAQDATEYALAMAECNANLQDTHGFFYGKAWSEWLGTHTAPVDVKLIEGSSVVTRVVGDVEGLVVGDIVLAVDGEKASDRRARLTPYFSASTPQALEWRLHNALLNGPEGSAAVLDVERADGSRAEVRVARSVQYVMPASRERPVFEVLPEGYGYIDLARLTIAQVDEAMTLVQDTPGLVFDMRGYPNATAWSLTGYLSEEPVLGALFRKPIPRTPDRGVNTTEVMEQTIDPNPNAAIYKGKVVTLIYAESISQAEHTCLFIEAATKGAATFIGSPTNGANGDVTSIVMPGGLRTMFSGHDVRHADGSQLQRKGIQPHIHAEPTIAGIRAGRDEVLEAAITFLQGGGNR